MSSRVAQMYSAFSLLLNKYCTGQEAFKTEEFVYFIPMCGAAVSVNI
jgi:hypothetical protein